MNCKNCIEGIHPRMCEACKKMQQEGAWIWYLDNGCRHLRCPKCDGSMVFPAYAYHNNYKFCPYCGIKLITGEQMSLFQGA